MAALISFPTVAGYGDDLTVTMMWDKQMRQGASQTVTLIIHSSMQRHPMKVHWTGLHLDWQGDEDYFENTTQFDLISSGSSSDMVMVPLLVQCPRNTSLGMHSDQILIEYLVQDGPNGTWNEYIWLSEEGRDFEVIAAPVDTASNSNAPDFFSGFTAACSILAAVLVVLGVVLIIVSSRRKKAQAVPPQPWPDQYNMPQYGGPQTATPQYGTPQYTMPQYGTAYYPAYSPPPQYPPGELSFLPPGTIGWICTECGSPARGESCARCGHVRGG